jgi:cell division protein FtsN
VNAPLLAMTPPAPSAPPAAPARDTTRFAVMFGPFSSAVEAQRVERTLIKAGHDALRARQEAGPTMYAVLIERISTAQDARTIMSVLREQAIGEAAIVSTEPVIVRVGDVHPLRGAVALAERVRKAGYRVRVAAQSGGKATYVIRHGSFATREEAEARSRELARLSVPAAQVVPVP